jgi:hypothetical protein
MNSGAIFKLLVCTAATTIKLPIYAPTFDVKQTPTFVTDAEHASISILIAKRENSKILLT